MPHAPYKLVARGKKGTLYVRFTAPDRAKQAEARAEAAEAELHRVLKIAPGDEADRHLPGDPAPRYGCRIDWSAEEWAAPQKFAGYGEGA